MKKLESTKILDLITQVNIDLKKLENVTSLNNNQRTAVHAQRRKLLDAGVIIIESLNNINEQKSIKEF